MRFTLAVPTLALAGLTAAQSSEAAGSLGDLTSALPSGLGSTDDLPSCFLTCLTQTDSDCSLTDFECLCSSDTFVSDLSKCGETTCTSQSDLDKGQAAAQSICSSAGVTLSSMSLSVQNSASASASSGEENTSDDDDDSAANKNLVGFFGSAVAAMAVAAAL